MRADVHRVFAALADPTRLAVVGLLRDGPLRSSDIARALDTDRPAMSRHLQLLRKTGLLEEAGHSDDARERLYRLRKKPFSDMRAWLDEVEAFWGAELESFQAHVERRAKSRPKGRA